MALLPSAVDLRAALLSPRGRALLALGLMLLLGCAFNADGAFFQWATHRGVLREISVYGILSCGMTLVVLTGGVDLAVGSVMALSAVTFSLMILAQGRGALVSVAAALAVAAAAGAASGVLVARLALPSFIATLATMVFARGLAKYLAGGRKVTSYVAGAIGQPVLPPLFGALDARILGGNVSIVTLVFLGCVLVTAILLSRLRLGRYLYAVGGNAEASRLSGVPVGRVLFAVYVLSGLFAGIAGICQAAQETQGDPETGIGYELDAIAMVVLGGTSLRGGRGGVSLTLLGALTIGYLQKILSLNSFSTEARLMLTGVIIVCAVLFQRGR